MRAEWTDREFAAFDLAIEAIGIIDRAISDLRVRRDQLVLQRDRYLEKANGRRE